MKLSYEGLKDTTAWKQANIALPAYQPQQVAEATEQAPIWLHFGAGNIFRGYVARLQQELLNQGLAEKGIWAADTFDFDIIDKIYRPSDSLTLLVGLKPDGQLDKQVIASVTKGLRASRDFAEDWAALERAFTSPSLQMVSFTITEKGYALKNMQGEFLPVAMQDFEQGPQQCAHAMSVVTALLYKRFQAGGVPVAMVSMDNCSHNGEKLKQGICTVAEKWLEKGFVTAEFVGWLQDETAVSFPWSMIDKITPRPADVVQQTLAADGVEEMQPIVTSRNTFIAPFVNAELPEYLVIEDRFPNGRPALEKAGVYFTDRQTVNDTERMKVTTCLNPLHTALAVYGCLLGYTSIAAEMQDAQLKALVEKIGYQEGLPVVVDPEILSPKAFLKEVLEQRLPNPYIPDAPQRIATDTSQKVSIRFGETIKAYAANPALNVADLTYIPLALAGWLRYLLAVDDQGEPMVCSNDPMLETMQAQLAQVQFGKPETVDDRLNAVLSNTTVFGCDLMKMGLGEKIKTMLREMVQGKGTVRATLKKYLPET